MKLSHLYHFRKDRPLPNAKGSVRCRYIWQRLHPVWKSLVIVIVLAIMGIPFYGAGKRAYGRWRGENDLAAARSALAAGQNLEARDLALAVVRGDPGKSEALAVFMRAADAVDDSKLQDAARGYLSLNTADKTERIFAWEVICKESSMSAVGWTWAGIAENDKADAAFLVPWLKRLLNENLSDEVEALLAKQPPHLHPDLERIRLSMLARRGTEVSYRELQARLIERIETHPEDAPLLLDVMDEIPQAALIPHLFTVLNQWIKGRAEEPSVLDKLRVARCEIAAHPGTADAVSDRMVAAHAADPLPLARWCLHISRIDRAEELLKPLVSRGDSPAFELMAEVLEAADKLERWDQLLEAPPAEAFLPGILCDRAFIAAKRGDKKAQAKFERDALEAAERQMKSDSLVFLARHASHRGMEAYASDIWLKAIRNPTGPLPFFSSINHVVQSVTGAKKESQLFDILTVYRSLEPGNLDVAVQHFYLACLNGNVTPTQVLENLSPVREKFPSAALDCIVALANLLEGDHVQAGKLTDGSTTDWFARPPALRAIRAIALTKTGRKEEADIYMEDFPWDSLLPSEARVFGELLKDGAEKSTAGAER